MSIEQKLLVKLSGVFRAKLHVPAHFHFVKLSPDLMKCVNDEQMYHGVCHIIIWTNSLDLALNWASGKYSWSKKAVYFQSHYLRGKFWGKTFFIDDRKWRRLPREITKRYWEELTFFGIPWCKTVRKRYQIISMIWKPKNESVCGSKL